MKRVIALNAGMALAYFVFGKLGLLMALPPGYVTAIWPPTGIALAGCLLWRGRLVWPGIFIGSTLTNATVGEAFQLGWLPMAIAAGSTLQALAGELLIRRIDPRFNLDRPATLFRSGLAVVVVCLIAPLVGHGALLAQGVITFNMLLPSFITWWIGDLLGGIIFVPLMLLVFDRRPVWRKRRVQSGLAMSTAFVLCIVIYQYANSNEEQHLIDSFNKQAQLAVDNLQRFKVGQLQQLEALAGLFDASEQVTPKEFSAFSERTLHLRGAFRAWSWAPLIPQDGQREYALSMTKLFGRPIDIVRPNGWVPNRDGWFVPVTHIEPLAGNEAAVGLDLNSEPVRADAIQRAWQTKQPAMTAKIRLAQDLEGPGGLLIVVPTYDDLGKVKGFCTAVLDLRDIALPLEKSPDLIWSLRDLGAGGAILHSNAVSPLPVFTDSSYVDRKGVYYQKILQLADRQWQLVLHKKQSDLAADHSPVSLIMLILAFSVCGVVGAISLVFGGERIRIAETVTQKTRELSQEIERRRGVQADLESNERRYRSLFDEAPIGHALNRLSDGSFIEINQAFANLSGYSIEEIKQLSSWELTPERYRSDETRQIDSLHRLGRYGPYEKHYICKNGQEIAVCLSGALVDSDANEPLVLSVVEDISERERNERRVKLLAKVFQDSGEGIVICDHDNCIVDVNDAFTQTTGYSVDEVLGKNPSMLSSGRTPASVYQSMWAGVNENGFWQGELWDRHKDGHLFPKWLVISVVRDSHGELTHYIGSFIDITERKAAEDRIHYLAHHDPLTDLPNRFDLQARLDQALASAQRSNSKIALMFIDMDRFKQINDTLGHHVGDLLLIEVAERLRSMVRDSDIVARLGGDEFVVVLTDITEGAVPAAADKILTDLGLPYRPGAHELHSSPSIGISLYPDDGKSADELMKHADTAMYQAKANGRNNYQFFTAEMNAAVAERLQLESGLRQALANNEFVLHYQPQIEVSSGRVVAVEALLRWQHPDKGLIPPLKFIPVAEETGIISPIGAWVLNEALRQLSEWRQAGLTKLRVAVNLSAKQLRDQRFTDSVAAALALHGLAEGALELEITETVAMYEPDRTAKLLAELRAQGNELAIDDFGTGYSSLSYLKLLPLDRLKLDRSFVKDIEDDVNDAAISAATISLSHDLGLMVVAEGVENAAQLDFLTLHGCDLVQGFHFSKPLPPEACLQFIRDNQGDQQTGQS